jgi:hypothetical protein
MAAMNRKSLESPSRSRQVLSLSLSAAIALLAALPAANAEDLGAKRFTLRGFGTVGVTTQNTDGIEFRRNVGQGQGVAAGDIELYTDSIAGVQFNATLNSRLDVVVQGVSRMRADGDWSTELSQGFVRYSPDESLVLRAGRIGYDIYLLAESRQVGYSYLAIRPSPDFYGLVANDEIDGLDVAYTRRLGPGLVRARLFGGRGPGEIAFADGTRQNSDSDIYGAALEYLYRGWTARVAMVHFRYDTGPEIGLLAAGLNMTGVPQSVAIAGELDHAALNTLGFQFGVAYDDGPLQAQILYGIADSDSIAGPDFNNLYALFGYRVRDFTPFVSFASSDNRESIRSTGLPDIPMFAPLNGAVYGIQSSLRSSQRTASVGVRYDFSSHFDLKLQVDRVSVRDSALIFDRRSPPGGPTEMTVFAAAVDFVF